MYKKLLTAVVLVAAVLGGLEAAKAELYQVQEPNGAVLFTNIYQPNAVVVTPKPITIMSSQRIQSGSTASKPTVTNAATANAVSNASQATTPSQPIRNLKLDFLLPAPNQAFVMTESMFTANVRVRPELVQGERVYIYVNNQLIGSGNNATVLFEKIGLGEHKLVAKAFNAQDQVLATAFTTFYVLKPVQGAPSATR